MLEIYISPWNFTNTLPSAGQSHVQVVQTYLRFVTYLSPILEEDCIATRMERSLSPAVLLTLSIGVAFTTGYWSGTLHVLDIPNTNNAADLEIRLDLPSRTRKEEQSETNPRNLQRIAKHKSSVKRTTSHNNFFI